MLFINPDSNVVDEVEPEEVDANGFKFAKILESDDLTISVQRSKADYQSPEESKTRKMFEGYAMAVLAGSLFGINFNPPRIVQDTVPGASQEGLDYVFSHFTGIFLASSFYFLVYCANQMYNNQTPDINASLAFPAWISGAMWAVAQTSWFVALDSLPVSVCFPIINIGPGLVGSLWGVFVYGEISGKRNYLLLLAVFVCAGIAAGLIVASQKPLN
jgi:hypothetical protein